MDLKLFLVTVPAALLLVVAGAANGAERIEEAGTFICAFDYGDELQLGEGHTVGQYSERCVSVADDPNASDHLSTGECVGTFESLPDESWNDSGSCTWTYGEGSNTFLKYWQDSGMAEGRYQYIGGTGKRAGASGGGTYTGEELTDHLGAWPYKGVMELP